MTLQAADQSVGRVRVSKSRGGSNTASTNSRHGAPASHTLAASVGSENPQRPLGPVADAQPNPSRLAEKFILTPEEAALFLGVSLRTIRYWVAERRIPYFHLGRFIRFKPAELVAFLEAGRVDPR